MTYLLEDLVINRVDLVDEGANSASFIELYKRKERSDTMELDAIIEKLSKEHAVVVQAEIDKLTGEITKAKDDLVTVSAEHSVTKEALAKAEENLKAKGEELTETKTELQTLKDEANPEDEVMKSMPEAAKVLFAKMKAQKEAAEEAMRTAKDAEVNAEAVAKAVELKALPIEQEKLISVLKGADKGLIELLTTINAAVDATLLGEVGKNKAGGVASSSEEAWTKIEAKATDIAKAKGISKAKAISDAVNQNPDLYKEYLKGGAN